jgi:hypothetical protein
MHCEPDPTKRLSNLQVISLENFADTDANGIKFQRLPVFEDRETPSRIYRLSIAELKSWSPEQEMVLLK